MNFAVNPEDFEKNVFISNEGDYVGDDVLLESFHALKEICDKNDSHLVEVIDSECQTVCFAPVKIAELIVKLLNESEEFGEKSFPSSV